MTRTPLPDWQYRVSLTDSGPVVEVGPGLRRIGLTGGGEVIGFPIDLAGGGLLADGATLDVANVDAVYERLAGRFIIVADTKLYLDGGGQIPCVFDPVAKVAGASPHSLLDDAAYGARFDQALFDRMGIDGHGYLPAGLTAHEGIARLLPNHVLDLATFTTNRCWGGTSDDGDPEAAIQTIIDAVRAQLDCLLAGPDALVQALTAGRETRMLLGCAKPYLDRMSLVTVGAPTASADTVMARRIAAKEGLSHRFLPVQRASPEVREAYLARNGHTIADTNSWTHPSVRPLADAHVFVGGSGGETGRGFFWRNDDRPDTVLTAVDMVRRAKLPEEARLVAAYQTWLDGLPEVDSLRALDLAYIEHRMGPWGGAQFPSDPTLIRFAPLVTRPILRAMLSLPADWKRTERMADAVIARTWPELAEYPFNSLGAFPDAMQKLRRAVARPGAVFRKLRGRM
ncbi:MAG: hypothetical protein AAGA87_04280 [Pseudomonadota bacterium]